MALLDLHAKNLCHQGLLPYRIQLPIDSPRQVAENLRFPARLPLYPGSRLIYIWRKRL
jgi:hypothetical protein